MKLNVNSTLASIASQKIGDERAALVQSASILTLEKSARANNDLRLQSGTPAVDYGFITGSTSNFAKKSAEVSDDILYFCAKKACEFTGTPVDRNNRASFTDISLSTNPIFMNLLSGIISETMYTVTPTLVNDLVGQMCSVETVAKGKTYEVKLTSNDVFQWYDSSWTALRSVPTHELYNGSITVNPKPKATRFRANWYQMTGTGGNLIDTLAAVAGGYAALVMKKFTSAFTTAAANTKYVPSALKAAAYTSSNWASVTQNVAVANRVGRDQLMAFGDFRALRLLLPDNATLASSIMTLLGEEYFKNGYIASHDRVPLYEIQPTVQPGTINSTLTSVFPTDMVIICARGNRAYAPMIMVFEEGTDMRINLTPGDDVIATGNIEGLAVASFDIAPCFASRIGYIDNVE